MATSMGLIPSSLACWANIFSQNWTNNSSSGIFNNVCGIELPRLPVPFTKSTILCSIERFPVGVFYIIFYIQCQFLKHFQGHLFHISVNVTMVSQRHIERIRVFKSISLWYGRSIIFELHRDQIQSQKSGWGQELERLVQSNHSRT